MNSIMKIRPELPLAQWNETYETLDNLPDHLKRDASMRGIERLSHDPYAAALVAQHRLRVYRQYRTCN
jgi:hypothetical protein